MGPSGRDVCLCVSLAVAFSVYCFCWCSHCVPARLGGKTLLYVRKNNINHLACVLLRGNLPNTCVHDHTVLQVLISVFTRKHEEPMTTDPMSIYSTGVCSQEYPKGMFTWNCAYPQCACAFKSVSISHVMLNMYVLFVWWFSVTGPRTQSQAVALTWHIYRQMCQHFTYLISHVHLSLTIGSCTNSVTNAVRNSIYFLYVCIEQKISSLCTRVQRLRSVKLNFS